MYLCTYFYVYVVKCFMLIVYWRFLVVLSNRPFVNACSSFPFLFFLILLQASNFLCLQYVFLHLYVFAEYEIMFQAEIWKQMEYKWVTGCSTVWLSRTGTSISWFFCLCYTLKEITTYIDRGIFIFQLMSLLTSLYLVFVIFK